MQKNNFSHDFSYAEGGAQAQASKPKRKSRSIILVTDVLAFYLNKEGKLVHKGGLARGRMLRLNCQKVTTQDGVKYVEVKNVKHHNIYIPLLKETWKPIEASDLEAFASKIAAKNNADIQDPEVVEQAVEITVNNINKHLSKPKNRCKGLDVYESHAFSADGFSYAEAGDENKSNAEGTTSTAATATTNTDTPAAAADTPATTTPAPAATTAKKSGSILLPSTVALLAGGGTFWTLNKYYSTIGDVKIYGATILAAFFGIAITEHFSKK